MKCVLDASTTVQFVLDDEFDAEAQRVLGIVKQHGAVVPTLWGFELASALHNAEKRGRITEAGVTHAIRGLQRLPIEVDSRPLDRLRVIDLARQFDLSAYDASYLWLAMDSNRPLATRDTRLAESASRAGVALA